MGGVFYVEDLDELDPDEEIQNLTYSTYSHFNDFQKLFNHICNGKHNVQVCICVCSMSKFYLSIQFTI